MTKEFKSLSEKIDAFSQHKLYGRGHSIHDAIEISHIKEFIKIIEKIMLSNATKHRKIEKLKKFAGDKLITK